MIPRRQLEHWLATIGGPIIGMMVLLFVLLVATGHPPARALEAFWAGALGSAYAVASATMIRAVPLILSGLAVAVAFRAGIWNIGAEGQLLMGATAATVIGVTWGDGLGAAAPIPAILAGMLAGALTAGIAGILRTRFGVLEIISTIMLNFIVLHFVGYLVRGPLQEASGIYPQSASLPPAAQLPILFSSTRLHVGLVIAISACFVTWGVLRYSAAGFRIRAVGANPIAARSAGRIAIGRTTFLVFMASGAMAGLAGAIEVTGVTFALYETLSPGYGYTAIAVALLARLNPIGVIGSGVLFGALQAGGAAMQRDAGVPSVLVSVVEAVLILAMATLVVRRTRFDSLRAGSAPVQPGARLDAVAR
jgi:simple sugar transport system permease protein